MTAFTRTRLMVVVERVVRPVAASASRKRKMREELLAHLTAVFEEEMAKLGDESLALEQTQQRLGPPAELTGQLQESVPPIDRWIRIQESIFLGPGVSTFRLACRYALFTLVPGAYLLIAFYLQDRLAEWPIVAAWAVLAFAGVFLVHGMRYALYGPRGRSWRKAALVAFASCFLLPAVTFAQCLAMSGDWRSSLGDVLPLLPVALLTPAALILPVCAFATDVRAEQAWANLLIE